MLCSTSASVVHLSQASLDTIFSLNQSMGDTWVPKQVSSLAQFTTQLQTVAFVQEWGEDQKQVT